MRLEGTLLVVKDLDVSRAFYKDVLGCSTILDLGVYATFEGFCIITEEQWSEFQEPPGLKYSYGNNVCQLGFEEEDIDSFVKHLSGFKIDFVSPLKEYPWGQRSMRFYDPDRHIVEVGEDMKVVTKRFLKSGMSIEETIKKVMYPPQFINMCWNELQNEGK